MHPIAGFAAAYALVRFLRRGTPTFLVAFASFVAGCEAAGLWTRPVPVVHNAGNLAFASLLVSAVVLEVLLWRRGDTLGAMLVAFFIWVMSQQGWCDPHSWLQGHAGWHLLCALAAYLLHRLYASARPRTEEPR